MVRPKLNDIWQKELFKYLNKEVEVEDDKGKVYVGICKAISQPHLNIVLMTDTDKIIVRNLRRIQRKRSFGDNK